MEYNFYEKIQGIVEKVYEKIIKYDSKLVPAYVTSGNGQVQDISCLENKIGFMSKKGHHGSNCGKPHKAKLNAGSKWKNKGGKNNRNNNNNKKRKRK